MSPDRPSYSFLLKNAVIPGIEKTIMVEPIVKATEASIDQRLQQGSSLPNAIAAYLQWEGEAFQDQFEADIGLPKQEILFTNFSALYATAATTIIVAEELIGTDDALEEITQAYSEEFGVDPDKNPEALAKFTAEFHIFAQKWVELLKKDPTGFELVDHVAYGTPHPRSPLQIISEYSELMRIVQIGAERYKLIYTAMTQAPDSKS
jgi:hypothetical protein